MSIQSHIDRLESAKSTLQNWLTENGYSFVSTDKIDTLSVLVSQISIQKFSTGTTEPNDSDGEENDLYLLVKE